MSKAPLFDGLSLSTLGFSAGLLGTILESEGWKIASLIAATSLFTSALFALHATANRI
jgi:hypothetical protein